MVLATLGQATYRRLHEARKSCTKNPASQVMDFSSNLQYCPNQGVSLIAGMEYGMERWNGKWNGTVNVHSYS